jgi:hypothetical protein
MCISNLCDPYVELATDVFKSQNPLFLKSLRDFLTGLPYSSCKEKIFIEAFHQLALIDVGACRWLLHNCDDLLPEVDFTEQAIERVKILLHAQGFMVGLDFSFESNQQLTLSAQAKARLFVGISVCDRLLLEEMLHIYN